jgi:para-nitrobenzyl esterase
MRYICFMVKGSFWIVVTILAFATSAVAQDHYSCNTQRYRLDVFENIKVTNEIKFGEETTLAGNNQELFMDIYEPADDDVTERPVIVLAFGGSFIGGSRRDMKPLCERFASRGYVVASIDYRLYDLPLVPFPTEEEMQDVVVRAIKDMKLALRYLDDDAKASNTFGIDMDWLYVGGISSGGITANHAAMLDSTDVYSEAIASAISTHSPIYGITDSDTSIKIRGVLNYSGALHDASWLDESDPPFISFHEDEDPTVPYKGGFAQIFGQDIIYLNGSFVMDSAAKAYGVLSELNTFNSNTHVGYFLNPEQTTEVIDASALFMYEMICSETADIEDINEPKLFTLSPNPFRNTLRVQLPADLRASISLLDTRGVAVFDATQVSGDYSIRTSELAAGVYFLKVAVNGQVSSHKVLKE